VVCKAAAGAVEHLPIARVRNVADWLAEAKETGAWVYGASADGVPYERPDYTGRVVLVLGSEGRGLRPRVAGSCDELVALPMRGRVDSLNVSAAAAALVYGVLQFRAHGA
jgi:23S rRNA (guanosine2251-2'-O)-methyltransferase